MPIPSTMATVRRRDRVSITLATPADLAYIVHLSKRHAKEVGFLTRYAMDAYLQKGRVTMARENGDPCGYFLVGAGGQTLRIFQAAVQLDARGLDHGKRLLSQTIRQGISNHATAITLHCRDGIGSNGFWSACGFSLDGIIFGGKSRRRLINCWRLDIRAALANPSLPYASDFLRCLTVGTAPLDVTRTQPPEP